MTTSIQSVIKNISKVIIKVPQKISFHVTLLLAGNERKNYASMARENRINYNIVRVHKDDVEELISESMNFLHTVIKQRAKMAKNSFLSIDYTLLMKQFAEINSAVTYDYDGVTKRVAKGISVGFMYWSDGVITIPFDLRIWLRKKDAGEVYKSKVKIAQELILLAQEYEIPFDELLLDGAFSSEDMFKFIIMKKKHFTIRISRARIVESDEGKYQLQNHPALQLTKNEKFKTIQAYYKGILLYFTVEKRKSKNDTTETVFIVSNVKRKPKQHVKTYKKRWPDEKVNRTAKQYLGLGHCQSTNIGKQKFHIYAVMVAYTVLQLLMIDKRKKSVEKILHIIRRQKNIFLLLRYIDLDATFVH